MYVNIDVFAPSEAAGGGVSCFLKPDCHIWGNIFVIRVTLPRRDIVKLHLDEQGAFFISSNYFIVLQHTYPADLTIHLTTIGQHVS